MFYTIMTSAIDYFEHCADIDLRIGCQLQHLAETFTRTKEHIVRVLRDIISIVQLPMLYCHGYSWILREQFTMIRNVC